MARNTKKRLKERFRQFREWEQQPHQVAPLSEEMHECATCGTQYQGNYCPRCGQSARIGRYSFRKAALLFLDVWGLGNRGLFRTLRDLLLRPGYMIRDYLRGMQMAYFPPFNLFFLLFTLTLLVDTGLNIKGVNLHKQKEEIRVQAAAEEEKAQALALEDTLKTFPAERQERIRTYYRRMHYISNVGLYQYEAQELLVCLLLFSGPLWLVMRHCPAIPDMRLSECFVAMVYISDMLLIYFLIPSLFCLDSVGTFFFQLLGLLLTIIPLKQLSGYSYWSTVWRVVVAAVPFCVSVVALAYTVMMVVQVSVLLF